MEKYHKWRDPCTGIHPFLPVRPRKSPRGVLNFLKRYLLGSILAIGRFPFLLVFTIWWMIMHLISFVIPIPFLKRLFIRYVDFLGIRSFLLFCGFFWTFKKDKSIKKRSSRLKSSFQCRPVSAGDIVLCNHVSFLDVLYLCFKFSPFFVVSANFLGKKSHSPKMFVKLSFFQALQNSIWGRINSTDDAQDLCDIIEESKLLGAPVVYFFEGTTSNGNSVLKPSFHENIYSIISTLDPERCHVLALKYFFEEFSPVYTGAGSFLLHFLKLLSQGHNTLIEFRLYFLDITSMDSKLNNGSNFGESLIQSVSELLGVLKTTKIDCTDKKSFLQFWNSH